MSEKSCIKLNLFQHFLLIDLQDFLGNFGTRGGNKNNWKISLRRTKRNAKLIDFKPKMCRVNKLKKTTTVILFCYKGLNLRAAGLVDQLIKKEWP